MLFRSSPDGPTAVGIALLDTLQVLLGEAFTEKACDAWSRMFVMATDTMLETA